METKKYDYCFVMHNEETIHAIIFENKDDANDWKKFFTFSACKKLKDSSNCVKFNFDEDGYKLWLLEQGLNEMNTENFSNKVNEVLTESQRTKLKLKLTFLADKYGNKVCGSCSGFAN